MFHMGNLEAQGRGKHTIRPLLKSGFAPPHLWHVPLPPSFPLEEMCADQTDPTFSGHQKWFWRAQSIVRFRPQDRMMPPPPFAERKKQQCANFGISKKAFALERCRFRFLPFSSVLFRFHFFLFGCFFSFFFFFFLLFFSVSSVSLEQDQKGYPEKGYP